jgi:glutamyl-tRNA(Gln) amidotransferase subunit D
MLFMYNEEIVALFASLGIKPGDAIEITSGKESFEGMLMPRSEAGDDKIIVIKRKDGYNMGVRYAKETKIKKLGEGHPGHFSFPKAKSTSNQSRPAIGMIYTGGTIGSKVDYVTGGVYMLTKPEELLAEVPELHDIANVEISELMSIASEDMTYKEWIRIADEAAKVLNKGVHGIVITHGTDTMHYTSAALSFMLKDINAPVVLTGAQRSSDRGSSDAFSNLICSGIVATKSDAAEVGICMHGSSSDGQNLFIRGTKARKMHTSRRDAFKSINSMPICKVDIKGKIEYVGDYKHAQDSSKKKTVAMTGFEPKVAIIKAYPNSDPEIIDHYISKGYKGLILEGTGLGHVPVSPSIKGLSWIDHVKRAVDSGMVVGATSQCINGRVNPNVYRNLRLLSGAGAIFCEDMMPEVAYVKLGFLLGNYDAKKAKEMLNVNIAGEITQRTEFDSFEVD